MIMNEPLLNWQFLYELVPEFDEDYTKTPVVKEKTNQSELDKSVDDFLTPAKPKSSTATSTKKGKPVAKVQPLRLKFEEVKDSCCLHFKDNSSLQVVMNVRWNLGRRSLCYS